MSICYRDTKCYNVSFCRKYSIAPFPTTQLTLWYLVAYLSKQLQCVTIRLYIPAVRAEQLSWGLDSRTLSSCPGSYVLFKDSPTRTRLPINPNLLQQLIQSILSNRHLSKYDGHLYATAISIEYFECLRAGEVSCPSTHSLHTKQHLTIKGIIIHQSTV